MAESTVDDRLTGVFFSLVRSGLWERPLSGEELVRVRLLSAGEWDQLWKMAVQQAVTGLLAVALELLPETLQVPASVTYAAYACMDRLDGVYRRHVQAVEELTSFFRGCGLEPVWMKGLEASRLYLRPPLRELGDIDVYFPEDVFEQALDAFRGHFHQPLQPAPDGSMHLVFHGLDVDIHRYYFDLPATRASLPEPGSCAAQLLLLNVHILKHACAAGVGLRQLCDMARAYAVMDASDPHYRRALEACRLLRWSRLLSAFLCEHLGAADAPLFNAPALSPAPLEKIVRRGGNFGHYSPSRRSALGWHPFLRKLNTLGQLLRAIPFSVRYAPGEIRYLVKSLLPGQLCLFRSR